MSIQNTLILADSIPEIAFENITSKIYLLNGEQEGRSLAYPYDSFNSVVMANNPIIESLNILFDTVPSGTKSFLSKSGYVIDESSTAVLKAIDDNDIWIKNKSMQLLSLLRTDDVESGISSPSEMFVKQALKENRMLALQMINQVYVNNVGNAHIQIGILHLSSHIDYSIGYPTLQTIAIAALSDSDDDVKDYAVQCYENWNHKDGLRILNTIHTDTEWLQNYIDSVIASLSQNFSEVASV